MLIIYTFVNIIIPILIPIGLGVLLNYKFKFDLSSLSKLNLYYYVPALAFIKIYEAKLTSELVLSVFGFLIIQFIVLAIIGQFICKILKYSNQMSSSFSNSILLTNNGNIGIPLNAMVFKQDPFAMSIQVMVVTFELIVTFTVGILNSSRALVGVKKSLVQLLKMPVIYSIIIGSLLNFFSVKLAEPIESSLGTIANGMVSFALVTIGAQIASTKFHKNTIVVLLSSFIRLVISPICAYIIISIIGLHGVIAQALFISSAIPTSRNSAALALEYNNEPAFAAQTVLVSTLLSSITLTIVINLSYSIL